MMTVLVHTGVVVGVSGQLVRIEASLRPGIPYFDLVGLAGSAIKEARTRVEQAVRSSAIPWPRKRMTLSLAPAELRKEGSALDLAMAVACLAEQQELEPQRLAQSIYLGELSLDGSLQAVRGVLPIVEAAQKSGITHAVVPLENAHEAGLVPGIQVIAARSLNEVLVWAAQGLEPPVSDTLPRPATQAPKTCPDWSDLRGQEHAKRAAEIALSGGHNILLSGPPGTGKTLLARCLPGLLPDLEGDELLEVLRVRSVVNGSVTSQATQRPFRAPHHSISTAGLVGGGRPLSPGEITIAHGGILFLDEFPEFPRMALESLRQPLEDGELTVTRAGCRATFPAQVMVVAAANPCPCGFLGSDVRGCSCAPSAVQRYRARLSGPILDRIDVQINMDRPAAGLILASTEAAGEKSASVRQRVSQAQARARSRQGCLNSRIGGDPTKVVAATPQALRLLTRASDRMALSPRRTTRLLKVARSIADLQGSDRLEPTHLAEALTLRSVSGEASCAP